jgi:hypothetical protein
MIYHSTNLHDPTRTLSDIRVAPTSQVRTTDMLVLLMVSTEVRVMSRGIMFIPGFRKIRQLAKTL